MIDKDFHLKIIDFGLAKEQENTFEKCPQRVGTLAYMTPEMLLN